LFKIPLPFSVRGSFVDKVNPFKSNTASAVTVVIPAIVPSTEVEAPSLSVPTLIVVGPVYVFVPERVQLPSPIFTIDEGVEIPTLYQNYQNFHLMLMLTLQCLRYH
jgi:hypothetical protein